MQRRDVPLKAALMRPEDAIETKREIEMLRQCEHQEEHKAS